MRAGGLFRVIEVCIYRAIGREFSAQDTVDHSRDEYVRGELATNVVEGFFSVLRRRLHSVYHSIRRKYGFSPKAVNRRLTEAKAGKKNGVVAAQQL